MTKMMKRPIRLAVSAAILAAAAAIAVPASACSAYSCDGVGWQGHDPAEPGVMAAYGEARRKGTVAALDAFIAKYPGSPAASDALDLKEKMQTEGTKDGGTERRE